MPRYTTGMLLAVSVTTNRTVRPSVWRFTLPASTSPPTRNARSLGASPAATCDGLKKNTRFERNAFRTSADAIAIALKPAAMNTRRLCRGFTGDLPGGAAPALQLGKRPPVAGPHGERFDDQAQRDHRQAPPDERRPAAHRKELRCAAPAHAASGSSRTQPACRSRSRMIARTRASDTAIAYIQKASAITSMPVSIVVAIAGDRVTLTEAPWCSVLHHCTEK